MQHGTAAKKMHAILQSGYLKSTSAIDEHKCMQGRIGAFDALKIHAR